MTRADPNAPAYDAGQVWPGPPRMGVALVSIVSLFLELLLIRWLGTEIRFLAYLQNTVLVACFLGLGLGCFSSGRPADLRFTIVPLLGVAALLALPPTHKTLGDLADLAGAVSGDLAWSVEQDSRVAILGVFVTMTWMFILMTLTALAFVPLGRLLGRWMDEDRSIVLAYSLNVFASLLGLWAFALLSVVYAPPAVWFALLAAGLLPLLWNPVRGRVLRVGSALALVPLAWLSGHAPGTMDVIWSPYQKLAVEPVPREGDSQTPLWVTVNGAGYQQIIDLRPETTLRAPQVYPPEQAGYTQYDIPLRLHSHPNRVLIAGAGSGNDAAGALRNGAKQVTAIEIDPAIVELGRRMHPEHPYADPRVRVVSDDARAFFASSKDTYDLVVFGLLDSHTMTAMTNARLDHYVYTAESLHQAHKLLAENGLLVLTFEARKPYIIDRIARTLEAEFGEDPLVFRVPHNTYAFGGIMFVAGNLEMARTALERDPRLGSFVKSWQAEDLVSLRYEARMATDDWPYLYLEDASVPPLFVVLAIIMAVVLGTIRRLLQIPRLVTRWGRSHLHFALLGAAFLLLEVQNISKASVLIGNTWLVSAVVISGVLTMVLLANVVAWSWPALPILPVGGLLCGSCVLLYVVDLAQFASRPFVERALVTALFATLPMFFAGILFIRSFQVAPRKGEALGANLAGSLVGGLIQPITYLVGIKALLLLVAACYGAAIVLRPRQGPDPESSTAKVG